MDTPEATVLWEEINQKDWDSVLERLKSHPEEASMTFMDGMSESLPLHRACKQGAPANVIRALLGANKNGATFFGPWGYLPLHVAVKSVPTVEVVSLLIDAYHGATRTKDGEGKFPLHLACQWSAPATVIDLLLTNYPECIYVRDGQGKTPRDYAAMVEKSSTRSRNEEKEVLDRAGIYCKVSKAAGLRAQHELDLRLKGVSEAHLADIAKIEDKHREEMVPVREINVEIQQIELELNELEARQDEERKSWDAEREEIHAMLWREQEKVESLTKTNEELLEKSAKKKEMIETEMQTLRDSEKKLSDLVDALQISLEANEQEFSAKESYFENEMTGAQKRIKTLEARVAELESEQNDYSKFGGDIPDQMMSPTRTNDIFVETFSTLDISRNV